MKETIIYPSHYNIFRSIELTPFDKIKVVFLGDKPILSDSYKGLAYSCCHPNGMICPTQLNIIKELNNDLGLNIPYENITFDNWAKEGVFLFSCKALTGDREGVENNYHFDVWKNFCESIFEQVCQIDRPIVIIALGNVIINFVNQFKLNKKHLLITGVHPSPFFANKGFFGSKIFSRANDFLIKNNISPINWASINPKNKQNDFNKYKKEIEINEKIIHNKMDDLNNLGNYLNKREEKLFNERKENIDEYVKMKERIIQNKMDDLNNLGNFLNKREEQLNLKEEKLFNERKENIDEYAKIKKDEINSLKVLNEKEMELERKANKLKLKKDELKYRKRRNSLFFMIIGFIISLFINKKKKKK